MLAATVVRFRPSVRSTGWSAPPLGTFDPRRLGDQSDAELFALEQDTSRPTTGVPGTRS
jgi:hypothetical protein